MTPRAYAPSSMPSLRRLLLTSWLALTACAHWAHAKESGPKISMTKIAHLPAGLFYFDDSDVILLQERLTGNVLRSSDAGENWIPVSGIPEGKARSIWQHPYDNQRAYVLSAGHEHWYTKDRGQSWDIFETAASPSPWREPLIFNAGDVDRIIFQAEACKSFFECEEVAMYSDDGFRTNPKVLRSGSRGCTFARSNDLFTTGETDLDLNRIICIVRGTYSPWPKDTRIVYSDNFFADEVEPELTPGRTVKGIINMANVKKFIVIAAKAQGTDEMALYVTDDTKTWHQAEFAGNKVEEDAYTVLESTNYSIQVDVMNTKPSSAMGILYTSNSNGTYFTKNIEHTNRNRFGLVDFEKVQGIQGIVLVNTVANWEYVEANDYRAKEVGSKISFDDGRTFQDLRTTSGDALHLHSVTNLHNAGRIFTSPAPGIVMGVGNTGGYLKEYDKGNLYVSDDAGVTWWKGRDDAHKYEFGDQGSVLVAVYDEGATNKIIYSIDHGHEWTSADLGEKVTAHILTTTADSTSLKFLLIGSKETDDGMDHFVFSINFEDLHERKCGDGDFEQWHAKVGDDGQPGCLMGHKQSYRRRKATADCFIDEEFKDPQPQFEPCDCADPDFECDFNFVRDKDHNCIPAGALIVPEGECQDPEDTFMGSSGYRLIPGNDCERGSGPQKDDLVQRPCKDSMKPPASGNIENTITYFDAHRFREFHYLERTETSSGEDETIIMRTDTKEIYITHDHGKAWTEMSMKAHADDKGDAEITGIYRHEFFNDVVFFTTNTTTVYYSMNRGEKIHRFEAPQPPTTRHLPALHFHSEKKDWLLWIGAKDCEGSGADCHAVAYYSTDRGDSWSVLLRYVGKCQFIHEQARGRSTSKEDRERRERLIYCEQYQGEDLKNPLQLVASDDFFQEQDVPFTNIVDFATMSEFIIVAARDTEKQSLKAAASIDGHTFADARFPPDFEAPEHQQAYTVLDSSTHSVFLHVTVSSERDAEYGALIKSNSNGTSYVLSIDGVNRNSEGFVDFEKMAGLEGVALANVIDNLREVDDSRAKQLKTMITHNDGAEWSYLPPPAANADGEPYACSGPAEECSLHLHGYTERDDTRDTYSSPSAVGMMIGTGNVGPYLTSKDEADTFLSRDDGISWSCVKKGNYLWEYGDQGSIIVLVVASIPTTSVEYSLDQGRTWATYEFSDGAKFVVDRITTVPTDNSRNFLLWGKNRDEATKIATVNLDFRGITDVQCKLDESDPEAGDYYLWEPQHPAYEDKCIFGHVAQYHRKKPEANCYNGRKIESLHSIARNCSCTRQDFECDYNFVRQTDGSCGLVPGRTPQNHSEICETDSSVVQWYEPTGYRRVPLSTCSGGHELEYLEDKAHPCPGHEEEFEEKHGVSGAGLFFAIVIPLAAAAGVGYWVWRNWDGKFGRIRLGEQGGSVFDAGSPWIQYPVMAVAVVVAVLAAVPDVMGRLYRTLRARFGGYSSVGTGVGRYTTRSSFARDRGAYASVENDEGELLGEDSDEEV
ncbi:MAG: vacuolar protein sorting/targeting protein PEP1 [Thelocarpon superellum]|nr:MAG: vacuolar protein sorting/targeting protein PEP1 [Thelocarpon superellum]